MRFIIFSYLIICVLLGCAAPKNRRFTVNQSNLIKLPVEKNKLIKKLDDSLFPSKMLEEYKPRR
jgi:hypothetical protein